MLGEKYVGDTPAMGVAQITQMISLPRSTSPWNRLYYLGGVLDSTAAEQFWSPGYLIRIAAHKGTLKQRREKEN